MGIKIELDNIVFSTINIILDEAFFENCFCIFDDKQAKLPELIYNLKPGEELLITDNNLPLAKLIGQTPTSPQRPGPGLCKGMITIVADDEEHLQDFAEYLH